MQNNIYFKTIEELYKKYIKVWKDVSDIESPSEFKSGVDACCDYFVKLANELGFSVEKNIQPVSGNPVSITMNPNAKGKPITFSGHIDTVHPVGSFGTPPTCMDDEKIYGPGVFDCKGGIVGAMLAMEALHKCGYNERPVQLLIQADEEVGSVHSNGETIKWMCEKSKDSVAFLNMEPCDNNDICVERKGIAFYKFKIYGVEAHASACAVKGANAIVEASHKIIELEKFKDNDGVTCSCNVVKGGTADNTVAGYCEFTCDVRFSSTAQYNEVKPKIEEIGKAVFVEGCTTEMELISFRCAMERKDCNVKLANDINSAFEKYGLEKLQLSKRGGGSDAAEIVEYGITAVDALGVKGDYMHSLKEFAWLEDLKRCAKQAVVIALEIN